MQTIKDLESEIHLKVRERKLRFCGKNVHQAGDFTIEVGLSFDAI